jgi:hypothetical protein
MADQKLDPQYQQMVTQAVPGIPAFLKTGIADNLNVVQAPPQIGYHGHDAVASVADNNPNTIRIHNLAKLAAATPAQRSGLLAHELTHRLMDQAPPTIRFKQDNGLSDPYSYDENNLNRPITNFTGEQLAKMVETHTTYANDATLSPARRAQVAAQYAPIMRQLAQLPQATINTQQPASDTQINPTANPPAGVSFDSSPPVSPTPSGPTVPQGGSGVQTDVEDITPEEYAAHVQQQDTEDITPEEYAAHVAPPESLGSKVMGFVGSQGLPILGGAVGAALGSIEPGAGTIAGGALGAAAGGELNTALRGATGQDTETGKDRVANDLSNAAGGAFFGKLEKGTQALTTAIADSTLPGRSVNALHTDIESVARKVAADAGVDVKPTDNVRKIISNTADAIKAKAQEKMDAIDDVYQGMKFNSRGQAGKFASGSAADLGLPGKFSDFDEQIQKLSDKLRSMPGADNIEARAKVQKQITELTNTKAQAAAALDKQGLGGARAEADALQQQAAELDKLKVAHNSANFGPPGKAAKTNPIKFQQAIQPLHESGSLHTAVGPQNAEDLMDAADRSARTFKRASAASNVAKTVGKLAVRGAAEGVGAGTAYRAVEGIIK